MHSCNQRHSRFSLPFAGGKQVEERLKFYDSGEAPRKNIAVMEKVAAEIAKEAANAEVATPANNKKKKRDRKEDEGAEEAAQEAHSSKKKKKKGSASN